MPKRSPPSCRASHVQAGHTQIGKVLAHARKENAREKVNALIMVSDACEETPHDLYAEARELGGVPVFMFQEGNDERVGRNLRRDRPHHRRRALQVRRRRRRSAWRIC